MDITIKKVTSIQSFFVWLSIGLFATCFIYSYDMFEVTFGGIYRPESFFGKNISLLNSRESSDRLYFSRHIVDFSLDVLCGRLQDGDPLAEFYFTARNKAVWGDANSIAQTADAETQFLEEVGRAHKHYFPRHIFWMREAWLRFPINRMFNLPTMYDHKFTLGAFPFQLGRGIALGDAYAVGSALLGFYTELSAVDQYAFGAKFSGDLVELHALGYDLYVAILNNKSGNLGDTAAKIRGQEYGRLQRPQRGFGHVNYLVAGRLLWKAFDNEYAGRLLVEPYWLYNRDPEQKIEFTADASSTLATIGMAAEYESCRFAAGFDGAVNLGHQTVRGWDRNRIIMQNRNGHAILVNSHVFLNIDPVNSEQPVNKNAYLSPYATGPVVDTAGNITTIGKKAQDLINNDVDSSSSNGRSLGVVSGLTNTIGTIANAVAPAQTDELFNAINRYRDPYINKYKGAMFVTDATVYFLDKDLQASVAAGIATGDENPNDELIDGDFKGFIGLQEIYAGKRVKSAFLLGGAGKLNRPLAAPTTEDSASPFARVVSGFTDLIFTGLSFKWEPNEAFRKFYLYPNLLFYWKEYAANKFDALSQRQLNECARNFLGTEINLFGQVYLQECTRLYFVGSVFIPGSHYDDIRGKPLSSDQDKELNRLDRTGFTEDRVPNLGNNTAFTVNIGLEFKF